MSSVNKVLLIGRLGQQPDMRYTPNGQAVTGLRLATNRSLTGPEGERRDMTDWHDIVVWGKQAETVSKYTGKGDLVYVEGRLQTRSWEGADGQKHYRTDVVAEDVRFLGRASQRAEVEAGAQPSPDRAEAAAEVPPSARRAEPEAESQTEAREAEPDARARSSLPRAEAETKGRPSHQRARSRASESTATERTADRSIER
jgi:single-strand DNA-binding protein